MNESRVNQNRAQALQERKADKFRQNPRIIRKMSPDDLRKLIREMQFQQSELENRLHLSNIISTGIATGITVIQAIDYILHEIARRFPDCRVIYAIIDDDGVSNVLKSVAPSGMPDLARMKIDLNKVPDCLNALLNKRPVIIDNVVDDPRIAGLADDITADGITAKIIVPVMHPTSKVGMLCVAAPHPECWDQETVSLMLDLADHISLALKNAQIQQERAQAVQALSETNEILEKIFSTTYLAIAYMDIQYNFIRVNQAFAQAYGYQPRYFVGKNHFDFYHDEEIRAIFDMVISTGWPHTAYERSFEYEGNPGSGKTYWDWTVQPVQDSQGNVEGLLLCLVNVTERRQASQNLIAYQKQLRSLAAELSLTEERERRTIAEDLHDTIGQNLALAQIRLEQLREYPAAKDLTDPLKEIDSLILQAIEKTHSLIFQLSPPVLHELGFEAAAEWLAEQFATNYDLECVCENHRNSEFQLDTDRRVVLFRAVRELLMNVVKHARARAARIAIAGDERILQVSVRDDGVGMEQARFDPQARKSSGFGMFNIRERLAHFDGHLEIASQPNQGTSVTLILPLDSAREDKGDNQP